MMCDLMTQPKYLIFAITHTMCVSTFITKIPQKIHGQHQATLACFDYSQLTVYLTILQEYNACIKIEVH